MSVSGDFIHGPAKAAMLFLRARRSVTRKSLSGVCPEHLLQSLIVQGLVEVAVANPLRPQRETLRLTEEGLRRANLLQRVA